MKTLLLPVDFSKESDRALIVAAKIAKRTNAKIMLIHMVNISNRPLTQTPNQSGPEILYHSKLAAKKFDAFLNKDFLNGITVEPILQKSVDFSSLNDLAKEVDADLIVMGTHGSHGLSEIFIGSNAEKVIRNSEIPVLVLKDNDLTFEPEKIVFVSDFELENIKAHNRILEIATKLGLSIEYLYINIPGPRFKSNLEIEQRLLNFFTELDHPHPLTMLQRVKIYADYSIEDGVKNFTTGFNSTIIAMGTHGRKGLAHFFQGSVSEDIANHSDNPVLTVKI